MCMVTMTVRVPDELGATLREEAETVGMSVNQVVVTAIDEWLARRADERADEVFREIAAERATLLHRLGTA
jgi:predicted transcriptional regulator